MRNVSKPFSETIFSYFEQHKDLPYLDQDLLNWFCRGDYVQLDKKYNVFSWWENALEYTNDCIIHYTIGKPWKRYNGGIDDFYWDYLLETPWCENKRCLAKYIRDAPQIEKALPFIEKNFLEIIEGKPLDKSIHLCKFTLSIWASVYHWLRDKFKFSLVRLGILNQEY